MHAHTNPHPHLHPTHHHHRFHDRADRNRLLATIIVWLGVALLVGGMSLLLWLAA